jgi:diguanylate cyclase (GGDEF)-like protein/PAS domain S-box-containing protein
MSQQDRLLKQQSESVDSETVARPGGWRQLVDRANAAHVQAERDCAGLRVRLEQQERELQQTQAELQAVVHAFPDLLARLNASGTILDYRVGASFDPLDEAGPVIGMHVRDVLTRQVGEALNEAIGLVGHQGAPVNVEYLTINDNAERFCEARVVPLPNGDLIAIVRDITARRQAEEALRESEIRKCAILGSALDAIMDLDDDGRVTEMNPAAERMFGCESSDLSGRFLADLVFPPSARAMQRQQLAHYFATGEGPLLNNRIETTAMRRDDTEFPMELAITRIELPNGMGFTAFMRDLTERKRTEHELTRLAFHDTLTGLPNRALFSDRLEHALSRARRPGDPVAVMFLDLDNFKVVNDSIGHEAGDQLLVAVADRLRACLRTPDTVARFGGDEFTILLDAITDPDEVTSVAERIAKSLRSPISVGGHEVFTTASIGIAIATDAEENTESLLRKADLAMYRSKGGGKAQYTVFDQSMNTAALERLQIESDLHLAIERGELRLVYQPIVTLDSGTIGELEALIRWDHPVLGVVSPLEFIPIAEENGLILPIGRWVLEEACRQTRAWQLLDPTLARLKIGVNLSGKQLSDVSLVSQVERILKETGLDPRCLKLELTESMLMADVVSTSATLHSLKAFGIELAIDDFGTGYSSLSYLKQFPLDTLKIDRSFVDGLGTDPQDTAIVRMVVALAKSLNLEVTGEGIETIEQSDQLAALGCERGQGYYFSKPLTSAAIHDLLVITTHGPIEALQPQPMEVTGNR